MPLLQAKDIVLTSSERAPIPATSFQCAPASLNLLFGPDPGRVRLFLRILGLLERPDSGEVFLRGAPTSHLSSHELAELRSRHFGYIFSEPFLLPSLSVFENVAMPLFKDSGVDVDLARQRTKAALDVVGLGDCAVPVAGELPLFDQYRVALARALVNEPKLLIFDGIGSLALEEREITQLINMIRYAAHLFGVAAIFSATDDRFSPRMNCAVHLGGSTQSFHAIKA